jgi:hypothetical protein
MLTTEQRAELEHHGAASIRFKLTQHGAGRGAAISGFKCGDITRGDIEDWLAEKNAEETAQLCVVSSTRIAGKVEIAGPFGKPHGEVLEPAAGRCIIHTGARIMRSREVIAALERAGWQQIRAITVPQRATSTEPFCRSLTRDIYC